MYVSKAWKKRRKTVTFIHTYTRIHAHTYTYTCTPAQHYVAPQTHQTPAAAAPKQSPHRPCACPSLAPYSPLQQAQQLALIAPSHVPPISVEQAAVAHLCEGDGRLHGKWRGPVEIGFFWISYFLLCMFVHTYT